MQEQLKFDLSNEAHQKAILKRVVFPPIKGAKTTAKNMRDVLVAIYDLSRKEGYAWPKLRWLAKSVGKSVAATNRATKALEQLGVLKITHTGRNAFYRISWPHLHDLDPAYADAASAPCARSVGTVQMQHAHRAHAKEQEKETKTQPPPKGDGWEEVERVLRYGLGVGCARECIDAVQKADLSISDVSTLIDEYREDMQREKWRDVGALVWRLQRGVWPQPSDDYARREQRTARETELQREREAEAAVTRREREAAAERERLYGPSIDALTGEEVRSIIAATGNQFLLAELNKRGRASASIRSKLIEAIAAGRAAC